MSEGRNKTKQEEDITRTGTHGSRHVRAVAVHEGSRKEAKRRNRNRTEPELITWLTPRSGRCGAGRKEEDITGRGHNQN